MSRPRRWTDDQLRRAAAASSSMLEVARRLGLTQSGPTNQVLRFHADRAGITLPDARRRGRVPDPPPRYATPLGKWRKRPVPSGADRGREAR